MNGAVLTNIAERAAQRYANLLGTLQMVFQHHLHDPAPGSEATKAKAVARAYTLAETYLADERVEIEDSLDQEVYHAIYSVNQALGLSSGEIDAETNDQASELATTLENALRVQLERDIATMTHALRQVALRASLIARSRGISPRKALDFVRSDRTATPAFVFTDRAHKQWASHKFVRTAWRQALVLAWNQTAMLIAAGNGITRMMIQHPDADYSERGTIISLDEDPAGITWAQVREEVFHPNSNAWLVPDQ